MHLLGWALTLVSLVQLPLWFLVTVVTAAVQGDVWQAVTPSEAWCDRRSHRWVGGGTGQVTGVCRDVTLVTNISYLASLQPQPPSYESLARKNSRHALMVPFNFQ